MNGTVTMELLSETVERLPIAELAFYPVAFMVLLLSWTTRAATPDPAAMAYKLGLPFLGRLAPSLNMGSLLVLVAVYFGSSLGNWALAWVAVVLAAVACPKPIEMVLLNAIVKSALFGSSRSVETFMVDMLLIARELAAKQGQPKDALVDCLKFELPFMLPIYILIDVHYAHFLHAAPTCEFFATDYMARDWFIGPNLLTARSPPMKNPEWLLHRALTSAVNTDRSGIESTMGRMVVQAMKILAEMSRDLKKRHGSVIDLCDEFEHIIVTAHLSAMFGQAYTDQFPMISKEVNYTAIKYSSVSNGMKLKVWQPLEGLKFLDGRKKVVNSLLWALEHSDSALLDIIRKAHKEGKITREELVGTCLLFTYALAPSRTSIFGLSLLANLPHEQDRVAKEVRATLPDLFDEKTGAFEPKQVDVWMTALDECDHLKRAVRETLRLYPGVPMFIPQMAARDVQIGPWQIPKGALTMSMPFLSQRDGKVHQNPDQFDPSRNLEKGAPLPDGTLTYFPFAMGPRSCAGQFYGELLVRAAMAVALREHEFEAKGPVPPPAMLGFIHPMAPAWAKIQPVPVVEKKKTQAAKAVPATVGKPQLATMDSIKEVPRIGHVDSITILYASTQGTSRAFADRLARGLQESDLNELPDSPAINVRDAADYPVQQLTRESLVIFVTSTFGHNQPPYSGSALKAFVNKPDTQLRNLSYAVLALGNSVYPSFCSFGKLFDKRLAEVGAQRLMPVTLCDEIEGQEGAFNAFLEQIADVLYSALGGADGAPSPVSVLPATRSSVGKGKPPAGAAAAAPNMVKKHKSADPKKVESAQHHKRFELVELGRGQIARQRPAGPIKEGAPKGTRDHPVELQVIANRCLRPFTSLAQIRNVVVRTPSDGSLKYQPGDLLGIYPVNRLDLVTSLAERLGIKDLDVEFELRPMRGKDHLSSPLPAKMTYWLALTSYLAIQRVPQPQLLKVLQQYTTDPDESSWLGQLGAGGPKYTEFAMGSHSLLETLYRVPSCKPDVAHLLEALPHLQPRMYSISSSPLYHPGQAHLTVAELIYQSYDASGWKRGVCSTFLGTDLMIPSSMADPNCRLLGYVMPNQGFHLPESPSTPIVMIAIGSGIAPFRGFWQHRQALLKDSKSAAQLGDALLYAGFQSKVNSCYLDELEQAQKEGALSKARVVFSREGERKYVTHALTEDRWSLWHDYLKQGAVVYVCGTINAANDVRETILGVIREGGDMSEEEAAAWLESAQDRDQYKEDVFGESTASYAKTRMQARLRSARSKLRASFRFLGAKGIGKILESAPPM